MISNQKLSPAPTIDDISVSELSENPYPTYARLRKEAPVARVSSANIIMVTRFETIQYIDVNPESFPAFDSNSLMIRAMGHGFLRMDGPDHRKERMIVQKSVSADLIQNHWRPRFESIIDDLIAELKPKGSADLFSDFAAPMASRCLMELLGLNNVSWQDLALWSQSMMDAVGNYANDLDIWRRCEEASSGIDAALEELVEIKRANPDQSIISQMVNAGSMPIEKIRANVKFIIGGGLNEPRDATLTAAHGLLSNREQLTAALSDTKLWAKVFEESVRYCAPIGMYPRLVAEDIVLEGVQLKKGDRLGLVVASACHDEKYWDNADSFDIHRKQRGHLAFGYGPHLCLGAKIARMQVGQLSVPRLFEHLPGLRFDPTRDAAFSGWVFRGPISLPVVWDS
jgi:cytochrome P450